MRETAHAIIDGSLVLRDGRRLGYAMIGDPGAFAVLYLHGAIGSPLRPSSQLRALVAELGIRYVMVSRPGFGASDPRPGRSLIDHVRDIEQLADRLDLERFAVVGVSGGGPYALACAHELPARVVATAAVSTLSPLGPPFAAPGVPKRLRVPLWVLAHAPRICGRLGNLAVRLVERHPRLLLRSMAIGAAGADRDLLVDGEAGSRAVEGFLAAAARGVQGMIEDYLITIGPWGFDPAAITGDVQLWHGMQDMLVPVDHALQLAISGPRLRLTLDPNDGHFFFRYRLAEILGALVGCRSSVAQPRVRVLS